MNRLILLTFVTALGIAPDAASLESGLRVFSGSSPGVLPVFSRSPLQGTVAAHSGVLPELSGSPPDVLPEFSRSPLQGTVAARGGSARGTIDPELVSRLRDDLTTAIANANLTEAQQNTLRKAGDAFREAAEARKNGRTVDRDAVRKAMAEVKKVLESDAFRPEDARLVKADLDAIQKAVRDQGRRSRLRGRAFGSAS